jgi:hypothetical protein
MPTQVLESGDLKVKIEPVTGGRQEIHEDPQGFLANSTLGSELNGAKHRLLSFKTEDDDDTDDPVDFQAIVYDYTNRRTLVASGIVDDPSSVQVTETNRQPRPDENELAEAIEILKRDTDLGPDIASGALEPYQAMPPLLNVSLPDGSVERTINVGLYSARRDIRHRFAAVNMVTGRTVHAPSGAPHEHADDCGVLGVDPCPAGRGSGKVKVTVTKGSDELWSLIVVKPSISSGENGSGVELRRVRYRGQKILHRAHVPILNVEYERTGNLGGCGPSYRDWQDEEACFKAKGENVLPGYRACTEPAETIFESGRDGGNFRGVAFYIRNQQLYLVSELAAGWYRYASEWRLHEDGTIRPRFGFNAVRNPCTCKPHHHHAYWRFDFDVDEKPSTVQEFNDPPIKGNRNWHDIERETRRQKRPSNDRKWRVRNSDGKGYELIPGAGDGRADDFGVGDVWVVRNRPGQLEDGFGPNRARIDQFVNGQSVRDERLVVWYAGHFRHSPQGNGDHIVGPRLEPFDW